MQKTSKIVAIVLTLVLVLNYPATVFANESENEFIRFFTDNSRMTKDGIFTFNIQISVKSAEFIAKKSKITVSSSCLISHGLSSESSSSQSYTITLYDTSNNVVGSYTGYADGAIASSSFSVTKNTHYYLIIEASPILSSINYLNGSGSVSNVTVINPTN